MPKYEIQTNTEKCTGCLRCQLDCSDVYSKWIGKSGFKNYVTEKPLTREDIRRMVEDYYEEWGWDRDTGIPTAHGLKNLGLK